jgi:PPOX class probable F420-dependent enzyme
MTREERETFLAGVHIAILSITDKGRGPLTVPIWYEYEPGEDLWMTTSGISRKGKLLKKVERISLCVQAENPPYKYVSIEGRIQSIKAADTDKDTRHLAHRYLGARQGDEYIAAMKDFMEQSEPILVRVHPERWLTFDATKDMK